MDEDEEIQCSFCRETLVEDNFMADPYGQFAYVTHTKLLHKAYEQTMRA